MNSEIKMLEALAPDMMGTVQERFRILRGIYWHAPIGRRALAEDLELTERVLRTETDFLKELDFISTTKSGMSLTKEGLAMYQGLEPLMGQMLGMRKMEKELAKAFGIAGCVVTAGDADDNEKVIESFGKILTEILAVRLPDGRNIIGVMGGTTMAQLASQLGPLETNQRHNLFVPARGGIGETVNIQANAVSAVMANQTGGEYRALYVPEQVSAETYKPLLQEPSVQQVLALINEANCVIYSVGRALHMAARRKMSPEVMAMLKQKGAVAETFGNFFNQEGEVVYKIPRIGLQVKKLEDIPCIFVVSGGKSKAKAIAAYMQSAPKQTWLITDEGAANEVLKGLRTL